MLVKIYTIRDHIAEENGPLFPAKNDAVAMRLYEDLLKSCMACKQDFELICVGSWDTEDLESIKSNVYPVILQEEKNV